MTDATVTVDELRDRMHAFMRAREWERYHNPKDLAIALSIEAAELLEPFLWGEPPEAKDLPANQREAIEDELADVVIYALHFANAMGTDVSDAVLRKLRKNEARFPVDRYRGTAR